MPFATTEELRAEITTFTKANTLGRSFAAFVVDIELQTVLLAALPSERCSAFMHVVDKTWEQSSTAHAARVVRLVAVTPLGP